MLVIPPPSLIKVASNTRPYSKLGGTPLNGREEGGQYYISQTRDKERFEARKVFFSWQCLKIFASGCSFSLPEWQAVKMTFFAPCIGWHYQPILCRHNIIRPSLPRHTPDFWLEEFALSSLLKRPFFLAPCRCMAMFRKEELLWLSNKKFHNNDVKSVRKRSEVLIAQWRSYIVLVITLIQITDKRQKAFGIFPSSGWGTNENNCDQRSSQVLLSSTPSGFTAC